MEKAEGCAEETAGDIIPNSFKVLVVAVLAIEVKENMVIF